MCGISGWIDFTPHSYHQYESVLKSMTDSLQNRGPDDGGIWIGENGGLGHRRLAILDPAHSQQPMLESFHDGDIVLVYSGEVYNYVELRKELVGLGHQFMTNGDTEVVLRSYIQWGEYCVEKFSGMFAFAIWDERIKQLLLVRDRLGIKPLYFYPINKGLLFGSEPKAILSHPDVDAVVDADGLRQVFGLIRSPGQAILKGMYEVKPAHFIKLNENGVSEQSYWVLEDKEHKDNLAETIEHTRSLLFDIVREQLVSDVPICTLLSGGLDSSTLSAIAQKNNLTNGLGPIRTFSVSFSDAEKIFVADQMRKTSDDPFIDLVVKHIGSEHKSIQLSVEDLLSVRTRIATLRARDLPNLGEIDSTLYLLFAAIRRHSTVALSGEGADELFGGYRWFHDEKTVQEQTFPWLAMARELGRYSMFEPGSVKLNVKEYQADLYADAIRRIDIVPGESNQERRMREQRNLHIKHFLSTPLERKDRMSMAVGLEVRVPYIDHRLVEYVYNIPWSMMTFDGKEKSLLRAVSADLLPSSVYNREKSPFPATQDPVYHAMLSDMVKQLLAEGTSPILELMNRSTMRALSSMPASGASAIRMGLERILSVHEWLTQYKVAIQI